MGGMYLQKYSLSTNQTYTVCKASELAYFSGNHVSIMTPQNAKMNVTHSKLSTTLDFENFFNMLEQLQN